MNKQRECITQYRSHGFNHSTRQKIICQWIVHNQNKQCHESLFWARFPSPFFGLTFPLNARSRFISSAKSWCSFLFHQHTQSYSYMYSCQHSHGFTMAKPVQRSWSGYLSQLMFKKNIQMGNFSTLQGKCNNPDLALCQNSGSVPDSIHSPTTILLLNLTIKSSSLSANIAIQKITHDFKYVPRMRHSLIRL